MNEELKQLCEAIQSHADNLEIGIYFRAGSIDPDGSLGNYTRQQVFNMGVHEAMQMVLDFLAGRPEFILYQAGEKKT